MVQHLSIEGKRDYNSVGAGFKPALSCKARIKSPITTRHFNDFGLLVPSDRHLMGFTDPQVYKEHPALFLLGSDKLGRDQLSRLFLATRISLSIGLVGVILSLILGVTIGGISGYYGGRIDIVIQRIIEVLIGIPTLPLWMALSAAVPLSWSVLQVYLAITAVLSIFSWTGTARVVRGKFLALREEEFVMAAKLMGATE